MSPVASSVKLEGTDALFEIDCSIFFFCWMSLAQTLSWRRGLHKLFRFSDQNL